MGVCDAVVWYSSVGDKAVAWQTAQPQTGGCVAGFPVGGAVRLSLCTRGHCGLAAKELAHRGRVGLPARWLSSHAKRSQALQACGYMSVSTLFPGAMSV